MISALLKLKEELEQDIFWQEQFVFFGMIFEYYTIAITQVVQGLF